jgi:hypothetical protein
VETQDDSSKNHERDYDNQEQTNRYSHYLTHISLNTSCVWPRGDTAESAHQIEPSGSYLRSTWRRERIREQREKWAGKQAKNQARRSAPARTQPDLLVESTNHGIATTKEKRAAAGSKSSVPKTKPKNHILTDHGDTGKTGSGTPAPVSEALAQKHKNEPKSGSDWVATKIPAGTTSQRTLQGEGKMKHEWVALGLRRRRSRPKPMLALKKKQVEKESMSTRARKWALIGKWMSGRDKLSTAAEKLGKELVCDEPKTDTGPANKKTRRRENRAGDSEQNSGSNET